MVRISEAFKTKSNVSHETNNDVEISSYKNLLVSLVYNGNEVLSFKCRSLLTERSDNINEDVEDEKKAVLEGCFKSLTIRQRGEKAPYIISFWGSDTFLSFNVQENKVTIPKQWSEKVKTHKFLHVGGLEEAVLILDKEVEVIEKALR